MKFGVREICDVVFKAKSDMKIGKSTFKKGQPVIYIDSAKTSTLEGASTSVYATGGKGNTRLIAWSGEKTLTFTVEDALLSPIGFTILSGAGLFNGSANTPLVHVHKTYSTTVNADGTIDAERILGSDNLIDATAPIFVVVAEDDGSVTGEMLSGLTVDVVAGKQVLKGASTSYATQKVFVDCYTVKASEAVSELQIQAADLAGNFYVEASTLFRNTKGDDLPAEITIPNVKIQSNFTFNMAATGDPSTFSFVMDAFPDYTIFDDTQKVLCVIQIIDEAVTSATNIDSRMPHVKGEGSVDDSVGTDIEPERRFIAPEFSNTKVYGKAVSELQSGVSINKDTVSGTLKKVTGWTEFSSDVSKQSGYYLAFKLTDDVDYTTATFEVINGDSDGHPVNFDADKNAVIYVDPARKQGLRITSGGATKEYMFTNIKFA